MRLHHFLISSTALLLMSHNAFARCNCPDDDDYEDSSYDYLLEGDFQLSLLLGIATLNQDDGSIKVAPDEVDVLTQSNGNDWDTWTGQFGVGYVMPLYWGEDAEESKMESGIAWFDTITPQINVYVIGESDMEGDVLRFGHEDDKDATYSSDFSSTRLMFDVAFDVLTIRDFSFYGLAGLGIAWNTTNLDWIPNPGVPIPGFSLSDTNSSGFAYEFGVGVDYEVLGDLDISLQYLYTAFDDINIQGADDFPFEVSDTELDVNAQSLLLGVRLTI